MFGFRKEPYSRSGALKAAAKALKKKKYKKAISLYREILKADPQDHEVHAKIAPLLARARQRDQAWRSFRTAAEGYRRKGFADKAIGLYLQASKHSPDRVEVWEKLADLKLERDLPRDAVQMLLEGRRQCRGRKRRPVAKRLLKRALSLEPENVSIAIDLAFLLKRTRRKSEAKSLLSDLEARVPRGDRRRLRAALFRISPSPGTAWRWLRAAFGSAA